MADISDNPGRRSYRNTRRVARQTMVLRKAKEEDARRLAELDAQPGGSHGATCGAADAPEGSLFAAARTTRLIVRGDSRATAAVPGRREETTKSGRQIIIRDSCSLSGRLSSRRLVGDGATSIRVAGGDRITRYASGDMVIHRGQRRASLQKQAILIYAAGYFVLFGLYMVFLFTGTTTIEPAEFVERSFARRAGTGIPALEQAAYEAMRGNRTPAEIRVAQTLGFYDGNGEPVHIEEGNRLTLPAAAKLAQAIIADAGQPESLRTFTQPIAIYRESHLSGVDWPVILSLYNAFGFFLLMALFLWRPLMHYLGTQGKKTAVALRNSRDALDAASEYKKKYGELDNELTNRAAVLRVSTQTRLEQERAEALEEAGRRAEEISGGIQSALAGEENAQAVRIGSEAARLACDRALDIVRGRAGRREHDAAIDELVAAIEGMGILREKAV